MQRTASGVKELFFRQAIVWPKSMAVDFTTLSIKKKSAACMPSAHTARYIVAGKKRLQNELFVSSGTLNFNSSNPSKLSLELSSTHRTGTKTPPAMALPAVQMVMRK